VGKEAQNAAQNKTRVSPAALPSTPVKAAQNAKPAKRVITNEDMGATQVLTGSSQVSKTSSNQPETSEQSDGKNPPEYWTNQILAVKNAITSLKSDIDQMSASIQYAPGNCVEGCVEWNQHQQEKQQQVDNMKSQLDQMQKQLEEMQEAARKQGYGSSVYDP
jgi:methyl-accepting chemotaxis protein